MTTDPLRRLQPPRPGQPAYRQIEEQLIELIDDGTLKPGDRVPPERDLAARLSVSRMTLRQALDGLVRRGLVERAGVRGTFVAAPKVDQDLRVLRSYPDELDKQGLPAATQLLAAETAPAPRRVASALSVEPRSAVQRVDRLRLASGEPFVLETAWVPVDVFPDLVASPPQRSLWDALATRGHAVRRAVERLEPVLAGAHEASLLGVAEGSPLMLVERTSYDASDRPVEFAVAVFRGDRARFIVEVSGAAPPADPAH
jgi:GntR family transcriptional regulator